MLLSLCTLHIRVAYLNKTWIDVELMTDADYITSDIDSESVHQVKSLQSDYRKFLTILPETSEPDKMNPSANNNIDDVDDMFSFRGSSTTPSTASVVYNPSYRGSPST